MDGVSGSKNMIPQRWRKNRTGRSVKKKDDYTAESWKAAALVNAINAAKKQLIIVGIKIMCMMRSKNIENAIEKRTCFQ